MTFSMPWELFCVTIYENFPVVYFDPTVIRNKDKPLKQHQVGVEHESFCTQFPSLYIMSYLT